MKDSTKEALCNYRDFGIHPGDFLMSVLLNDLNHAFSYGDSQNITDLREILFFVHEEMPWGCWGTEAKIKTWMRERVEERMEVA